MSSKTEPASGSGTSEARWLSYHARSYLVRDVRRGCAVVWRTYLIIAEDLVRLLKGREALRRALGIVGVLVWVMDQG